MGINKKLIIDYTELEFGKKIGEGSYGQVFKGEWQRTDVAIKVTNCLKTRFPDKIVWFLCNVLLFHSNSVRRIRSFISEKCKISFQKSE